MRDASGDINDLWNIFNSSYTALSSLNATNETTESPIATLNTSEIVWSMYGTKFNCTGHCLYGSHNSFQVFLLTVSNQRNANEYLIFILTISYDCFRRLNWFLYLDHLFMLDALQLLYQVP